jgi:hypothetical protein
MALASSGAGLRGEGGHGAGEGWVLGPCGPASRPDQLNRPLDRGPPAAFRGYTRPKLQYTLQSVPWRCLGPDAAALRRAGPLELQG